nr:MAG TPA: hypothetical protein [Caudoviricetes sp.]
MVCRMYSMYSSSMVRTSVYYVYMRVTARIECLLFLCDENYCNIINRQNQMK